MEYTLPKFVKNSKLSWVHVTKHVFHEILFLGLMSGNTGPAAVLRLVFGNGQTLNVSRVSHGYHYVLAVDKVAHVYFVVVDAKLAASGGIVFYP